jgi:YidC/Oxa1 family membrane protein insertase
MDIVIVPIMTALEWINTALAFIGIPYSFGFAIIIFTLLIKLVTAPLNAKQIKASRAMQDMQPKIQELQKKYKDNKEELSKRQMALYKEAGVNPLGGCLPTLIQFPIWIGLYQALFRLAHADKLGGFLWIPSLAEPKNSSWLLQSPANWDWVYVGAYIVLPVLTVVTQIVLQKMMTTPNPDPQTSSMNRMMSFMPLMFGFFAIQVPSGLSLYWVTMNIFSMVQQYLMTGWGGLAPKKKGAVQAKGSPARDETPAAKASPKKMESSKRNLSQPKAEAPAKRVSKPKKDPSAKTEKVITPLAFSGQKGQATGGDEQQKP